MSDSIVDAPVHGKNCKICFIVTCLQFLCVTYGGTVRRAIFYNRVCIVDPIDYS